MTQSVTAQSHSSHDPAIDMVAPPTHAAMNPQQNLVAAPQQPSRVAGTTIPLAGAAVETTELVPAVIGSKAHYHGAATERGGTTHHDRLTTIIDFGLIMEQLQSFPPLPPYSTYASAYTSN
ncbi:unnamed protein product [Prunus brigantina]